MRLLKSIARVALHQGGGLRVVGSLTRGGLRILMYHRFRPARPGLRASLDQRCAWLRRHYHPVSLTEVARAWGEGKHLPPNSLAVTVDDGYRDFYEVAYPIFFQHRVPVTVFLASDFLDGKCWLWVDQIEYACRHAQARRAEIALPGGHTLRFSLESDADRSRAAAILTDAAKEIPNSGRRALLEELPGLLNAPLPRTVPDEYAPVSWEAVREMARNGIEFGAHTKSHPILSRVEEEAELREEIAGSRLRIESELGRSVRHFCYPNGRPQDIGSRVQALVKQLGFETAVTTEEGLNFRGADPFLLKRLPADPSYPESFFREYVAGVRAR